MDQQLIVHVVDRDFRSRGDMVRGAMAHGHAAHGYDDLESLAARAPRNGVIVLALELPGGDVGQFIARLDMLRIWLPVIVAARDPAIEDTVAALRGGAQDVLGLPLDLARYCEVLRAVGADSAFYMGTRRRFDDARRRIDRLTPREREVLDWLTIGRSNKAIAREMAISPRTVEVHRANMMGKLDASHPADAVRLRLELGPPISGGRGDG